MSRPQRFFRWLARLRYATLRRNTPTLVLQLFVVLLAPVLGMGALSLIEPPKRESGFDEGPRRRLTAESPDYLLLGNCAASYWIDVPELARLAGGRISILWSGSSRAVHWYLQLKNLVVPSESLPRRVVILFENAELTEPLSSSADHFQSLTPLLTNQDISELYQELYAEGFSSWNRLVRWLDSWNLVPLRTLVADAPSKLALHASFPGVELSSPLLLRINALFDTRTSPTASNEARVGTLSGESPIERSLLPRLTRLAKENRIPLAFVRRSVHSLPDPELENGRYFVELREYLESRGYPFLDLTQTMGMTPPDREESSADFKIRFTRDFHSAVARIF